MPRQPSLSLADALTLEGRGQPSEVTRKVRVRHGLYTLRDRPGRYLVRVRLPAGIVSADQIEALAGIAEAFGDPPRVHITTRQGVELYGVQGPRVEACLARLSQHGLTTRNTGGNVVRGAVCCPRAGVDPDEVFDVTPYALAADRVFRDHPSFQRLPRKVKIAFEGCADDHVHTAVSDIGLRADVQDGRRGFRITIGGGLGASPMAGVPLESFTPVDAMFTTITSILNVFDAHGNRAVRARARLKWLVHEWGAERFCAAVLAERRALNMPAATDVQPAPAEVPTADAAVELPFPSNREFADWSAASVRAQRQAGLVAVGVRVPLGDLFPNALRALADCARRYAGSLRLTIDQNVLLRSVRRGALPILHADLAAAALALGRDERLIDITCCAGRATCTMAVTDSRAAAEAVAVALRPGLAQHPALQGVRVRVSGCPNSCGHHHLADIGLFGVARRIHGRPAPCYSLVLGGSPGAPGGVRIADIPARRTGIAVDRILSRYLEKRQAEESFGSCVRRCGPDFWRAHLADLTATPPDGMEADFLRDAGASQPFAVRGGAA